MAPTDGGPEADGRRVVEVVAPGFPAGDVVVGDAGATVVGRVAEVVAVVAVDDARVGVEPPPHAASRAAVAMALTTTDAPRHAAPRRGRPAAGRVTCGPVPWRAGRP
ncbi:MAG: hypothetical protein ABR511_04900 [Acidimicrobiales bacterium]